MAYRLSLKQEWSVIDWCSPDFQGLAKKMCEGTGKVSWPLRALINAVCTSDLYCSAREFQKRMWSSASIKPEQSKAFFFFVNFRAVWFGKLLLFWTIIVQFPTMKMPSQVTIFTLKCFQWKNLQVWRMKHISYKIFRFFQCIMIIQVY